MATKPRGGAGGIGLSVRATKKITFFAASQYELEIQDITRPSLIFSIFKEKCAKKSRQTK